MFPDLNGPVATAIDEQDAAAETMRRTGHRIGAPTTDIDLVLDVLLAEVQS